MVKDEILQYIDKFLDSMNAEADGRYIFMRYSHFLLFCIQLNSFHFPFSANFNPVLGVRLKYINEPLRQGSQADHQSGQDHTQPGLDLHQNGQQGRCNSQASEKKERKKQKVNKKTQSTQTDQKEDIEAKDESTMYDVIYTMEKATVTEKDSEDKATQTEEANSEDKAKQTKEAKKKIKKTIEWVRL